MYPFKERKKPYLNCNAQYILTAKDAYKSGAYIFFVSPAVLFLHARGATLR